MNIWHSGCWGPLGILQDGMHCSSWSNDLPWMLVLAACDEDILTHQHMRVHKHMKTQEIDLFDCTHKRLQLSLFASHWYGRCNSFKQSSPSLNQINAAGVTCTHQLLSDYVNLLMQGTNFNAQKMVPVTMHAFMLHSKLVLLLSCLN